MRSTLGAPFGGATRGGHHALDSAAVGLISPPNFGGGGGSAFEVSGSVYAGEPGLAPLSCPPTLNGARNNPADYLFRVLTQANK